MRAFLAVAAACLAALLAAASAQPNKQSVQLPSEQDDDPVTRIQQFCAEPQFSKRSCGWADATEFRLPGRCIACGTAFSGGHAGGLALPFTYQFRAAYPAVAYGLPSLACRGSAVVRSVFKQNNYAWNRTGCADFRLESEFTEGTATEVVRCELQLPSGGGSEVERALRSKEVNCRICNRCLNGGGCPGAPGKWYSDSLVVNLPGCGGSPAALAQYGNGLAVLVLNPGTNALLAKFEICQRPGCFDPAAEAAKLRGAKGCVKGVC